MTKYTYISAFLLLFFIVNGSTSYASQKKSAIQHHNSLIRRHRLDSVTHWFYYLDADNDPPGDCPLPGTEDDIDSKHYIKSLSRKCRRVYKEFPESTLHVSSEEYIHYLTLAQEKGAKIFTIDYALQPEHIKWIYRASRKLGFVPFVSNRELSLYIKPFE